MDELTPAELDQLMAVFRDQSLQILEEMNHDLLALESGSDSEAMPRLRRGAHTIKGDSACIGLDGITQIAHRIEDVFDAMLASTLIPERRAVDAIFKCLDAVRSAIGGQQVADISSTTVGELVAVLASSVERQEHRNAQSQRSSFEPRACQQPAQHRRDYVRVEASKLDTLLNLAGEMVIARSVIGQLGIELDRSFPRNDLASRYRSASGQIGKLIAEFQKSVLKMRMVTIDHVLRRFARPMRELAAECDKEVELHISGGETELDRTLVDLVYEPLLHLLRNAVDHGIETKAERVAAGKPRTGQIAMRAYHEGNQVIVEVSDDGRGIDPAAVKARAVEVGAATKQQVDQMSDEEAIELIFLEGLSTAREITQLSGRGVGASSVKSAIEQLRGSVAVKSELGRGTCFTLRMPLTLAIIRALLFNASGQLFALPLLAVSEIARADAAKIVHLDGVENYRLRDRFISLVRPGVVLSFDRRRGGAGAALRNGATHSFIIVLAVGEKRYGVVADELAGEQELVIKPLDSKWVQNEALAGAAVLGDGRVVLIMDAEMVFRKAVKYERGKGTREAYAV